MRIVAGAARGRRLAVPGRGTRPTSDRVREALFSRLEHLDAVDGAAVLDLFAGSGALGLEAVSRGATSAVLVDASAQAAATCRSNAAAVGLPGVRVVTERVVQHLRRAAPADLVLVDPPYDLSEADLAEVLDGVARVLRPAGVVVVERSARSPEPSWPAGLVRFDERRYGETAVWFAEEGGARAVG